MHWEVFIHFVHVAGPRKLYPFKLECSWTTSTSFAGVSGQLVWSHSTVQVVDPGWLLSWRTFYQKMHVDPNNPCCRRSHSGIACQSCAQMTPTHTFNDYTLPEDCAMEKVFDQDLWFDINCTHRFRPMGCLTASTINCQPMFTFIQAFSIEDQRNFNVRQNGQAAVPVADVWSPMGW